MTAQDGSKYQIPTYTETQSLTPAAQGIFDTNLKTQGNLANIGNSETAKIGSLLSTPVDLSSNNVNNYTNTNYQPGFNQLWDRNANQNQQKLADQGITPSSQAYQNAQTDFNTQRQQSYDQYAGDMYNNAQNSILQQRNQPINEISALLSGSQVAAPATGAVTAPTQTMPTVDYSSLVNQNYNQQLQASSATNAGLFGLGSAALGGWKLSDRRLKNCIVWLFNMANGLGVYSYRYVWGGEPEIGVMADEVARLMPDAVTAGPGGFMMADYAKVA